MGVPGCSCLDDKLGVLVLLLLGGEGGGRLLAVSEALFNRVLVSVPVAFEAGVACKAGVAFEAGVTDGQLVRSGETESGTVLGSLMTDGDEPAACC